MSTINKKTALETCESCEGTGKESCSCCNGIGTRWPELPRGPICDHCRGKGNFRCLACGGSGEVEQERGTTDFSTPESRAESELMARYLEHAPQHPGPLADGLRGWWLPAGNWLCAKCAGRIFARGCQLPRDAEAVFVDKPIPYGVCCCCEGCDV